MFGLAAAPEMRAVPEIAPDRAETWREGIDDGRRQRADLNVEIEGLAGSAGDLHAAATDAERSVGRAWFPRP